jgi:protein gp37
MGVNSKIEWTDATWSPWHGCTKISPGCANCYAAKTAKRNPGTLGIWGPNGTRVVAAEATWREPLKWDRQAKAAGVRKRVFCASIADVFEDWTGPVVTHTGERLATTLDDLRDRLFALIALTPHLDWLVLSKRADRMSAYITDTNRGAYTPAGSSTDTITRITNEAAMIDEARSFAPVELRRRWPLPNVWLGVSVEDQQRADERIPLLLRTPAAVRFLSCEPLLSAVDLRRYFGTHPDRCKYFDTVESLPCGGKEYPRTPRPDWVIVGGESGPGARPMHPDWARSLRDQCKAAGVAFFFKQWGEWGNEGNPHADNHGLMNAAGEFQELDRLPMGLGRHHPQEWSTKYRVGKKAAGRLLDGREYSEFPEPARAL